MKFTDLASRVFKKHRHIILYGIIGVSGASLDALLFALFLKIDVYYQLANTISGHVGIINNFTWNTLLNFKKKDRVLLRFVSYYCVGLTGLCISSFLLWFFTKKLMVDVMLSKIVIIFVVTAIQFMLNKFVTFRELE